MPQYQTEWQLDTLRREMALGWVDCQGVLKQHRSAFRVTITFKDQQKPYLEVELVCIHSVVPFMHHKKDHGFSWHEALHNINMLKGKCFLSTTGLSSTFIRHHDNTITFLKRSDISFPLTWLEVTRMLFTPLFPPAQCFSYEVAAVGSVPFSFSFSFFLRINPAWIWM